MVDYSLFGERLCGGSGIEELMEDLGNALVNSGGDVKMLGGGQPSAIPEMNSIWRERLQEIMDESGRLEKVIGNYDPPRGNLQFLKSLAGLFREKFGWDVSEKNLAVTAGGQTAFFFLFNAMAGRFNDGTRKKILLPLVPEYLSLKLSVLGSMVLSIEWILMR